MEPAVWVQISLGIVVQVLIALFSYLTIHRYRAVYDIKTAVLRLPHGESFDKDALDTSHIDTILRTGKYTILQIVERPDKDLQVVMGRIRKSRFQP